MAASPLAAPDPPLRYLARDDARQAEVFYHAPAWLAPGIIRTQAWPTSTTHRRPDRPQRSRPLPGSPPKPRAFIG
jgi:hypothetical protein